MIRALMAASLAMLLAACASQARVALQTPELSAVGQGISGRHTTLPTTYSEREPRAYQSLWSDRDPGLFRDVLARKVGDIVTVAIDINDKAQFDNQTGRSRTSSTKTGGSTSLSFGGLFGGASGTADGNLELNSDTSSKGEGSIDRSEKLQLSVAAVVTEVLPDGNLLISGSQEVRVNFEVRVLTVAGVVRPTDISNNNVVAYDKIAEARVSYGGRGRISEVQQPSWGQRILDAVSPY